VGRVDYVAGNPPWVRWGYLPKDYRESSIELWKHYGLFSLKGFEARLGSGEKDLSQLFVYACIDYYLKDSGRLGFLITQTVFKAKGQAEGFRRFRLGSTGEFFAIKSVNDLSKVRPFEGASNLTVSFVAEKGSKTEYPVPYTVWIPRVSPGIQYDQALEDVLITCDLVEQRARPVDSDKSNSEWQTSSASSTSALALITGASAYKAKIGARTDPYGVFQVRILKNINEKLALVENCAEAGKRKIQSFQLPIESELLFPLVRGRDVGGWVVSPELYVIMTQDPVRREAIAQEIFRRSYPKALEYFTHFKSDLESRGSRAVRAVMASSAFYAMFAVGVETYAPYKVAWRRMGNIFRASIISNVNDQYLGKKLVIPSDTVSFVPFHTEDEAFFFLGLINSSPARAAIYSFSPSGRGLGSPAILKNLRIALYSGLGKELRSRIVSVARDLTKKYQLGPSDFNRTKILLDELDICAAKYWSLTSEQLASCVDGVRNIETTRPRLPTAKATDQELLGAITDVLTEEDGE
jgi:hypothetical protein